MTTNTVPCCGSVNGHFVCIYYYYLFTLFSTLALYFWPLYRKAEEQKWSEVLPALGRNIRGEGDGQRRTSLLSSSTSESGPPARLSLSGRPARRPVFLDCPGRGSRIVGAPVSRPRLHTPGKLGRSAVRCGVCIRPAVSNDRCGVWQSQRRLGVRGRAAPPGGSSRSNFLKVVDRLDALLPFPVGEPLQHGPC